MQIVLERTENDAEGRLGSTLVLGSALLYSLSGVLTKAIDADSWTILTWRGLIGGLAIAAYVRWRDRDRPLREVLHLGPPGWLIAGVVALASTTFIFSFKNTFVANVSIIYATIPFVAAGLEWVVRREPIRTATIWAATTSLVGVGLIVNGSLGSPSLSGDLMAMVMVALNALFMVLIRTFPETDSVLAGAASGPVLFVVGWFLTDPLMVSGRDVALLVLFGSVFAAATVLLFEGTRRIPAADAGLLGSAETPVAIALAWLLLSEAPPLTTVIGALVVLGAIVRHTRSELVEDHQKTRPESQGTSHDH